MSRWHSYDVRRHTLTGADLVADELLAAATVGVRQVARFGLDAMKFVNSPENRRLRLRA